MKKQIDVFEHTGEILQGLRNGVLITSKSEDKVNSMTISWGDSRRPFYQRTSGKEWRVYGEYSSG